MNTNIAFQSTINRLDRIAIAISRNWWWITTLFFGLYAFLPFTAPVFMRLGWEWPARVVYFLYSFFCHQLPERSLFLFGAKPMYALPEVQTAWQNTSNPLVLRQFIGNPEMGWKVAWSDRMVSMYTSIFLFSLLWRLLRRRIRSLPWWGFALLLLPMFIDGMTHLVSDLWGIEQGFRQNNFWLAELSEHALSDKFYAGNALGSINSWMRWISGILFGLGAVWFIYPYIDEALLTASKPPMFYKRDI